jgi:hypothetical protein
MKCIISRSYGKFETLGTFMVMDGEKPVFKCKCLELPDNGNQHDTSCIPEGIYDVIKYTSPTKGECFHVLSVPWRDSILIHKGNYKSDTLGCILVGSYFVDINDDGNLDVAESTKTLKSLLEILPDRFKLVII